MKKQVLLATLLIAACASCSKKNDMPDGGNTPGDNQDYHYGSGTIYIKQGTEGITKIDMPTGILANVMPDWADAGWDISWDGTTGIKQINPRPYETTYLMFSTHDGSTIREISYEPGDNSGGLPNISPDGTKLALRPTLNDGLVILDMNGHVLKNISGYGSAHEFEYLDPVSWAPDGSILFRNGSSLWRTSTDFGTAHKVRDIPFSDWNGAAAASPDGSKIALSAGNHIYLMNADGSDFHAVTESSQEEVKPSFSPDSKYIAIAANSRAGSEGDGYGTAFHLCLVPADGQVYKVYPGEDDRVIQVILKGTPDSRGLGKTIVGDFVWRK